MARKPQHTDADPNVRLIAQNNRRSREKNHTNRVDCGTTVAAPLWSYPGSWTA
jgi:hypothetical protein